MWLAGNTGPIAITSQAVSPLLVQSPPNVEGHLQDHTKGADSHCSVMPTAPISGHDAEIGPRRRLPLRITRQPIVRGRLRRSRAPRLHQRRLASRATLSTCCQDRTTARSGHPQPPPRRRWRRPAARVHCACADHGSQSEGVRWNSSRAEHRCAPATPDETPVQSRQLGGDHTQSRCTRTPLPTDEEHPDVSGANVPVPRPCQAHACS